MGRLEIEASGAVLLTSDSTGDGDLLLPPAG